MKRTWSFKSRASVFWGIVLIGAAALLILNGIGVNLGYGISVWRVLLGTVCLAWLVDKIVEARFTETIFPLAFLFLIFEPTIAHAIGREDNNLISDWTVLLAALLLTIGLKAIAPDRPGKKALHKAGSTTIYLDGAELTDTSIHDNLGSVQAYVTNTEAYSGNGTIKIHDNLGKITLHIPSNWNVITETSDNLGHISVPEQNDGVYDKSITLRIHDNMGSVNVVFD